eukprot:CAMPEP_0169253412 /NCGR_PEP_ID=MMETSP1016-20121227/38592_1 /TAXON_ID=342587 /ORGANISM="Karlodinium micrum, Strain CCMP2283" /LENGTH=274 /DNA_ID=CAMNT_0009334733 /DNA_START=34 /DNA_END=854 /DNA_ORIENTATION=+
MKGDEDVNHSMEMPEEDGVCMSSDVKTRSARIYADPKMKELQHYQKSHQHEMRLRETANLATRVPSGSGRQHPDLRNEGCEKMDSAMKQLSKQEARVSYVCKSGELPDNFLGRKANEELKDSMEARWALLRRMDRFETRLTWRDSMDHSLKRLLVDMDLSRDERLQEYMAKHQATMADAAKHQTPEKHSTRFAVAARCNQLDKVFDWYRTHGRKEVRKERNAPPYLRYDPQDPVMPGSLRVAKPMNRPGKLGSGMGLSSSSPALLAAGAEATRT